MREYGNEGSWEEGLWDWGIESWGDCGQYSSEVHPPILGFYVPVSPYSHIPPIPKSPYPPFPSCSLAASFPALT